MAPEIKTCLWKDDPLTINDPSLQSAISGARATLPDPWMSGDLSKSQLAVWRITDFRTVAWPVENYGQFYMDEVYLILNTQHTATIGGTHHIHIWVGRNASQEEYATAVCKMVDLDQTLGHEAILHRETEGAESEQFKCCFNPLTVWRGGCQQSYKVCARTKQKYASRLLQYYQPNDNDQYIRVKEMFAVRKLEPTSVYMLDLGHRLMVCIGALCNQQLVHGSLTYSETLKANRGGATLIETLNHDGGKGENGHEFYTYLTQDSYVRNSQMKEDKTIDRLSKRRAEKLSGPVVSLLFKVSSKGGQPDIKKVKDGNVVIKDFEKHNVCILDSRLECFLWINKKAAVEQKKSAMEYIHEYLRNTNHPLVPVSILREGQNTTQFERALAPPEKHGGLHGTP